MRLGRAPDSELPSANFHNESAVSAFYSCGVTPWLYVGADMQFIDPAKGGNDRALVAAVRTQIRF